MDPALKAALAAGVAPVRKPVGYGLAAVGVAAGMVLLPLVYVGFLAILATAVVLYASLGLVMVLNTPNILTLALYFGPLVIGGIVFVFMVKPLFTRRERRGQPVSVSPADEPALIAFVEQVADAVGAPRPSRVDVDCRPNASASFRRGVLSMVGTDLVLTIGLPLVDALTVRQMAGVLAHEYGHFAQGSGMRLTYVVERISLWFARVAYERTELDTRLRASADEARGWMSFVLGLSVASVALSRNMLGTLMNIGQALSRRLLRQMEFDADRYEVRIAGLDAFRATSERLVTLSAAEQAALADLSIRIRDRRLPDDWPAILASTHADLPDAVAAQIIAEAMGRSTDSYDTHPSLSERLASAEREGARGLPLPDDPARTLFTDFEGWSRRATLAFYESGLSPQVGPVDVIQTRETLDERAAEVAASAALARLSSGLPILPTVEPMPAVDAPGDASDAAARLGALRNRQQAAFAEAQAVARRLDEIARQRMSAVQAIALAKASVRFRAEEFGLERPSVEAANERLDALDAARAAANADLAFWDDTLRERVAVALRIAAASDAPPAGASEVGRYLDAARQIDAGRDTLRALQDILVALSTLVDAAMRGGFEPQVAEYLDRKILGQVAAARTTLATLRAHLDACPYPFRHRSSDLLLGSYVVEAIPGRLDVHGVLHRLSETLGCAQEIQARVWGALAEIVEHVEAEVGLPLLPLPEPAPVDDPPAAVGAGAAEPGAS